MTDVSECFRRRSFKEYDGRPFCTMTEEGCDYQDYSETRGCRMYSSTTGWTEEELPLCSHPDVAKLVEKEPVRVLHDDDLRYRVRK